MEGGEIGMTLEEMQEKKRKLGYSNEDLAKKSGIPLSTVQKVMAGVTKHPRRATMIALEATLNPNPRHMIYEMFMDREVPMIHDPEVAYKINPRVCTIEDIYALPEGIRAELIDGKLYFMATPTRLHQEINGELYLTVANYIRAHGGECKVFIPPFAVFLYEDNSTYLEPDLTVVCDKKKLNDKGCVGAPDWVIEIVSPSSRKVDCVLKAAKFRDAGVREYWVVYPEKRIIQVYQFEKEDNVGLYSFEEEVPSGVIEGLTIRLADTF